MIFANNFARNHEKNNTWNIRLLVDDSFVPLSKQPSVIYCRLTDFCRPIQADQQQAQARLGQ